MAEELNPERNRQISRARQIVTETAALILSGIGLIIVLLFSVSSGVAMYSALNAHSRIETLEQKHDTTRAYVSKLEQSLIKHGISLPKEEN